LHSYTPFICLNISKNDPISSLANTVYVFLQFISLTEELMSVDIF